jgi:hypothetical protein
MTRLLPWLLYPATITLLLADEDAKRYNSFLEASKVTDSAQIARRLDEQLTAGSIEYRDKRAIGRPHPPHSIVLRPGSGDAYKQHLLAGGQREAQFKYLALQYRRECAFDFEPWVTS